MEDYIGIQTVSSVEIYKVNKADAKRVYDSIPKRVRRGRGRLEWLIKAAICCISAQGEDIDYLIGKIDTYYRSEEGRGSHPRLANTWLQDEGWDEHEDLWNPERAREANRRDGHGQVLHGQLDIGNLESDEEERKNFIESHSDKEVSVAAIKVIDDLSNGYATIDQVLGSTYGKMLLARQLKTQ